MVDSAIGSIDHSFWLFSISLIFDSIQTLISWSITCDSLKRGSNIELVDDDFVRSPNNTK